MDERGNGALVVIISAAFIITGIIVALATVTGMREQAIDNELLPAMKTYFVGIAIAIILTVVGVIILVLELKS